MLVGGCGPGLILAELIIVMVILGILAATDLPRFVDLSTNANSATRSRITGSLNTAITTMHSKYLAAGISGPTSVALDSGTSVTADAAGYPDVTVNAANSTACRTFVNAILGAV